LLLFVFQGCLKPVKTLIPKGSILDPSENAAVVGGNVLTSQRIVDVILKAFGVCGASQVSTYHTIQSQLGSKMFQFTCYEAFINV